MIFYFFLKFAKENFAIDEIGIRILHYKEKNFNKINTNPVNVFLFIYFWKAFDKTWFVTGSVAVKNIIMDSEKYLMEYNLIYI